MQVKLICTLFSCSLFWMLQLRSSVVYLGWSIHSVSAGSNCTGQLCKKTFQLSLVMRNFLTGCRPSYSSNNVTQLHPFLCVYIFATKGDLVALLAQTSTAQHKSCAVFSLSSCNKLPCNLWHELLGPSVPLWCNQFQTILIWIPTLQCIPVNC